MSQKCRDCGARLSSYNSDDICFPCQKKRKERLVEQFSYPARNRPEYIDFLLADKKRRPLIISTRNEILAEGNQTITEQEATYEKKPKSIENARESKSIYKKPRVQISLGPIAGRILPSKNPIGRIQSA